MTTLDETLYYVLFVFESIIFTYKIWLDINAETRMHLFLDFISVKKK